MHTSGLARPPRPARRPPPERRRPEARAAPAYGRPYADFGRVLRWSLLASLAVHALILLLSPAFLRVGLPPGATDTPYDPAQPSREIQLLNPVASAQAPTAEEAPPLTRALTAPAARPAPARVPTPSPSASAVEVPPAPTAGAPETAEPVGGALRPGYRDPRLWVNPRDYSAQPQRSNHQRYMEHLQARVDALNDSTYAANQGPNTDWTFKDKNGKRWGLSEEGLHLGGVTLPRELVPLPAATGDNQSREAAREKERQRDEIRRQEEERERRRKQEEGARATRERKDAERKKGGGG